MEKEAFVQSFDGTRLFLKTNLPETPKAIAVVVHGLCEHLGRYEYLTHKLLDHDFGVYRFDHRGHGRSEGKPAFYSDFNEIIDDVNCIVEMAKDQNPGLPVFLIGHSMGGFAVSLFGIKYPGKVKGIVTSGALTRGNKSLPVPPGLPADTYIPNELASGVCSDPMVVEAYKNDPLVGKQFTAGLLYSLAAGVEWNKQNANQFVDPVLVLHGSQDGLVSEKDSRDFFGEIASEDKTLIIYSRLFHEIFNEPSKDEVIGHAMTWIEKHLS